MEKKKLHPGVKWAWRVKYYMLAIFSIAVLSIATIILVMGAVEDWIIISSISVVSILIAEISIGLEYRNWSYELAADGVKIERGIASKTYSDIPYSRIQNIGVKRGILARIFGFSSVDIKTIGESYRGTNPKMNEGYIPAVDDEEAENMRNIILSRIKGNK